MTEGTLLDKLTALFGDRCGLALKTWDPLKNVPLLKWLDPFDDTTVQKGKSGKISFIRFLVLLIIGSVPPLIFSLISSRTLGGGFWDETGMKRDAYHFFAQWIEFPCFILLILLGRRLLGDMINHVKAIYGTEIPLAERIGSAPWLLRLFEWLSRLNPTRILFWIILNVLINTLSYISMVRDGQPMWLTSPSSPGSLFYFARFGNEQPNFAGLYAMIISGTLIALCIVILARIVIEFSLAGAQLSKVLEGRIMPASPDNTGNLLVVGKTALVLSLPIMIIGFGQTVVTLQEIYIWGKSIHWSVFVTWALYFILCPLFFLLPLVPLRRTMYRAKRASLLGLQELYRIHFSSDDKNLVKAESQIVAGQLQGHCATLELIERVTAMSVWPFDKRTFTRFVGVVISPILPLLASEAPKIMRNVFKYLFH